MIDKFIGSMAEAMAGIEDGATVLVGGFGDVGAPAALLDGLAEQGARELTIVIVAGGRDGSKIERLVELGRIRKMVCSFVRPASLAGRLFQQGKLDIGDRAARHAGGTGARRRRRHRGLLHPHRRRHDSRRGPRNPRHQRQELPARICDSWRRGAGGSLAGRPLGQPDLSRECAELQSGHGDGRRADHRR